MNKVSGLITIYLIDFYDFRSYSVESTNALLRNK